MKKFFRTAGGSALSSAGYGLASIAANLLLLPVAFRVAGVSEYGVWVLLTGAATFLYQADLGIGTAVMRGLAVLRSDADLSHVRRIISSSMVWMVGASVLAMPLYGAVAYAYWRSHTNTLRSFVWPIVIGLGLLLVSLIWTRLFLSILQGLGYWSVERATQVVGLIVRVAGSLLSVIFNAGIVGIALSETVALIVPGVICLIFVVARIKHARPSLRYATASEVRALLAFSLRASATSFLSNFILQVGPLILGFVSSASSVAMFTAAARILAGAKQALSWIVEPLLPGLASLSAVDSAGAKRAVNLMARTSLIAGAILSGVGVLASPWFVSIWLGSGYDDVVLTSQWLFVGLLLNSVHLPAVAVSNALGRPGSFLVHYATWAVAGTALAVLLGGSFGSTGVALGLNLPLLALEAWFVVRLTAFGLDVMSWARFAVLPGLVISAVGAACWVGGQVVGEPGASLVWALLFVVLTVFLLIGLRRKLDLGGLLVLARLSS